MNTIYIHEASESPPLANFSSRQAPVVSGYSFGRYRLCKDNQRLIGDGMEQTLACKNFLFLCYLCESKLNNSLLEKNDFAQLAWQGRFVSDQAIARVVSTTRKLFKTDTESESLIETVRKRGYRLTVPVKPCFRLSVAPIKPENTNATKHVIESTQLTPTLYKNQALALL